MSLLTKILVKNSELLKHADAKNVEKNYLSEEDVFIVSIGKQVKNYDSIETEDGLIIIHYDKNLKITGFTIPYVKEFVEICQKKFAKQQSINTPTINSQTLASATIHYFTCSSLRPGLSL